MRGLLVPVRPAAPGEPSAPDYVFFCPGCKCGHGIWLTHPNPITGAMWTMKGTVDRPTFEPSLRLFNGCHLSVTDGTLHFHGDCTHPLAGKSVPMQPLNEKTLP